MTLSEIQEAVKAGKVVCWSNAAYQVKHTKAGQWLIACINGSCIGLTHRDGVTMNGKPEEFFIGGAS